VISLLPDQKTWLLQELQRHPLIDGQSPHQWLLWRTKVAEGLSEADAWAFVVRSNNPNTVTTNQAQAQAPVQAQLQPPPAQSAGMVMSSGYQNQDWSQPMSVGGSGSAKPVVFSVTWYTT
jgi:hypothetical protein